MHRYQRNHICRLCDRTYLQICRYLQSLRDFSQDLELTRRVQAKFSFHDTFDTIREGHERHCPLCLLIWPGLRDSRMAYLAQTDSQPQDEVLLAGTGPFELQVEQYDVGNGNRQMPCEGHLLVKGEYNREDFGYEIGLNFEQFQCPGQFSTMHQDSCKQNIDHFRS